jgi:predicted PurR-regulated permease PerM
MKNQLTNTSFYDTIVRLFILILIVGWCLMIMMPFVSIMLWSLIFSFALGPLHTNLSSKMNNKPKLASVLIIGTMLLIMIIPAIFLIGSLVGEVKELKVMYKAGDLTIPPPTDRIKDLPVIGTKLYDTWNATSVSLEQTVVKYQDQLVSAGKTVIKGILGSVSALFQIIIAFIIGGVLLVLPGVKETIGKFFKKLAGARGDEFAETTQKTVGSVVKGIIGVALILALLHGIIFMLAGIPFAGLWTLMVFVLCVLQIPVIIVTLPIIVYLFAQQGLTTAIIWTVLLFIAGLSDNVLKPLLLGKGAPVPMLVIFIGVIGGFIFSGFIGLFTGAIVMSIGYKLFIAWIDSNNEVSA